jgi:hypothetical protein
MSIFAFARLPAALSNLTSVYGSAPLAPSGALASTVASSLWDPVPSRFLLQSQCKQHLVTDAYASALAASPIGDTLFIGVPG